jgi:hypothetical protein
MITGMPRIAIAVRDLDRAMNVFHTGFGMPVAEVPGQQDRLGCASPCAPPTRAAISN